ncbi:MAG: hypothetical protein V1738_06625 [Patescibacteria group bacterium]
MLTFLILLDVFLIVTIPTTYYVVRWRDKKKKIETLQLTDGEPSDPQLTNGDGPYRTSTEIVDQTKMNASDRRQLDERLFGKLSMASHCMEENDPRLVSLAKEISIEYLLEQLDDAFGSEIAIHAFQARSSADDVKALIRLNKNAPWKKYARVRALRGNSSAEAITFLLGNLGTAEDSYDRELISGSLNDCRAEAVVEGLKKYLGDNDSTVPVTLKIIHLASQLSILDIERLVELLAEALVRPDLNLYRRDVIASELAKLPGGKERLAQLI